jgi:hypothetical protein
VSLSDYLLLVAVARFATYPTSNQARDPQETNANLVHISSKRAARLAQTKWRETK